MRAVFDKNVAKSPEGLKSPNSSDSVSAIKDGLLVQHFSSVHHNSINISFGSVSGSMAYSTDKQNPLLPRYIKI